MTGEERKNMRVILLLCAAKAPLGLTVELARVWLTGRGVEATGAEIAQEIAYLVDKNLMTPVPKRISPEMRAWRITADGRDFLAEEGYE